MSFLDLDRLERIHPDEPGINPFVRPLIAEVRSLQAHIDLMHETWAGAVTVTRERDEARAAIARVEAAVDGVVDDDYATTVAAAVRVALRGDG